MIKELIVVEGRDDQATVKSAVSAETLATHGYGIRQETLALIRRAYEGPGIIIFMDPDFAGEKIRQRLSQLFPEAKHAYLSRQEASSGQDIGVENAAPAAIREALEKARCLRVDAVDLFSAADLSRFGLVGTEEAAARRDRLGQALGIGYGNSKTFLKRLNYYGITREEFEQHGKSLFTHGDSSPQ